MGAQHHALHPTRAEKKAQIDYFDNENTWFERDKFPFANWGIWVQSCGLQLEPWCSENCENPHLNVWIIAFFGRSQIVGARGGRDGRGARASFVPRKQFRELPLPVVSVGLRCPCDLSASLVYCCMCLCLDLSLPYPNLSISLPPHLLLSSTNLLLLLPNSSSWNLRIEFPGFKV